MRLPEASPNGERIHTLLERRPGMRGGSQAPAAAFRLVPRRIAVNTREPNIGALFSLWSGCFEFGRRSALNTSVHSPITPEDCSRWVRLLVLPVLWSQAESCARTARHPLTSSLLHMRPLEELPAGAKLGRRSGAQPGQRAELQRGLRLGAGIEQRARTSHWRPPSGGRDEGPGGSARHSSHYWNAVRKARKS